MSKSLRWGKWGAPEEALLEDALPLMLPKLQAAPQRHGAGIYQVALAWEVSSTQEEVDIVLTHGAG